MKKKQSYSYPREEIVWRDSRYLREANTKQEVNNLMPAYFVTVGYILNDIDGFITVASTVPLDEDTELDEGFPKYREVICIVKETIVSRRALEASPTVLPLD